MKRKFVSNLIFVLLLNVIIKPFYILGIDAEILRVTELQDPGTYGTYFSLLSLSFVFNILLDLGINNYNTRSVARDNERIHLRLKGTLTLKIVLAILYLLVLFLIGYFFSYNWYELKWLLIIGFNQILVAMILFLRSNLSALLMLKEDSIISVLDRLILILFCGYFLWAGINKEFISIEFFILSQTLAYSVTLIICFIMLSTKTKVFKLYWDFKFFKATIKSSLPFALLIFLMSIYYYSDVVMIERMKNNHEAVSYAHGYRFFMAFNMIGFLFAGILLPIFSKMIKDKVDIKAITWLSFRLIFLISVIICLAMWPIKEEILSWRYALNGDDLQHSSNTFGWLLLSFVAVSCNYIFGTLLTANGSLKQLNTMALIGVLINLILNFSLIPSYGSEGAAFASMITQFFTLIAQIYIGHKFFKFNLPLRNTILLMGFLTTVLLSSYVINVYEIISSSWMINLVSLFLIGTFFGLAFKIVALSDVQKLLKSYKNDQD